VHSA
jgi:hypothetical protein